MRTHTIHLKYCEKPEKRFQRNGLFTVKYSHSICRAQAVAGFSHNVCLHLWAVSVWCPFLIHSFRWCVMMRHYVPNYNNKSQNVLYVLMQCKCVVFASFIHTLPHKDQMTKGDEYDAIRYVSQRYRITII